jgi:hypothetical protein
MRKLLLIAFTIELALCLHAQNNYRKPDPLPKRDSIIHPQDTTKTKKDTTKTNKNVTVPQQPRKDSMPRDDRDPKVKPKTWRDTIP